MALLHKLPPVDDSPHACATPALGDRAVSDLRYIRSTIERSGRFTAVPGWGAVGMGLYAIVAGFVSAGQVPAGAWLLTWSCALAIAIGGGALAMTRKASREGVPLFSGLGRKFLLGLCPPLIAGAVLSVVLHRAGMTEALPAVWLLLYGTGVVTGGAYSVTVVPITGAAFMVLGTVAAVGPATWGTPLLVLGFGGLHLLSGFWIARHHGG